MTDFYALAIDLLNAAEKLDEVSKDHPQITGLPYDMKRVAVLLISYFPKKQEVEPPKPTLQESLALLHC